MAVNSVLHVLGGAGYRLLGSTVAVARRAVVVVHVPPVLRVPRWQEPDVAFFGCHTLKYRRKMHSLYLRFLNII